MEDSFQDTPLYDSYNDWEAFPEEVDANWEEDDVYIEDETYWEDETTPFRDSAAHPTRTYQDAQNPSTFPQQQQILIGYPTSPLMEPRFQDNSYFCKLYPKDCATSNQAKDQKANCSASSNCTAGDQSKVDLVPKLGNVDLSGMGLGLLLVSFLLLALHLAWNPEGGQRSESKPLKGPDEPSSERHETGKSPVRSGKRTRDAATPDEDRSGADQDRRRTSKHGDDPEGAKTPANEKTTSRAKREQRPRDTSTATRGPEATSASGQEPSGRRRKGAEDGSSSRTDGNANATPEDSSRSGNKRERPTATSSDRSTNKSEARERQRDERPSRTKDRRQEGETNGHRSGKLDRPIEGGPRGSESRRNMTQGEEDPKRSAGRPSRSNERNRSESSGGSEDRDKASGARVGRSRDTGSSGTTKQSAGEQTSKSQGPEGSVSSTERSDRRPGKGDTKGGEAARGSDNRSDSAPSRAPRPAATKSAGEGAPSAKGRTSGSEDTRTPEQKSRDKALEEAEARLTAAKETEKKESRKARDQAKEANGGVTPSTVPSTPELEQAKKNRKRAQAEVDSAARKKHEADSAAKGPKEGGAAPVAATSSNRSVTESGTPPSAPKPEKAKSTGSQSRTNAGVEPQPPATQSSEKQEKRRLKDAEKAREVGKEPSARGESKTTPPSVSTESKTTAQRDADKDLEQARKKVADARATRKSAEGSGDQARIDDAKEKEAKARRDLKQAKDAHDKAHGKSPADTTSSERNKSSDPSQAESNIAKAKAKFKDAQAAEEGDRRKAAEEYKKARDTLAKELSGKDIAESEEVPPGSTPNINGPKWWMIGILGVVLISLFGLISSGARYPAFDRSGHASPILPPRKRPLRDTASHWMITDAPRSSGPNININNMQGSESFRAEPAINVAGDIVGEQDGPEDASQPFTLHLSGPSNPDRVILMILALFAAALPLMCDWARDWPTTSFLETAYLRPLWHWLVAGIFLLMALCFVDQHLALGSGYVASVADGVQIDSQMLASAIEGGERLVWGLEDLVFGESRHILGMILAASLTVLVSQRKPVQSAPKTEYAPPSIQMLYLFGSAVVGLLFWNA